MGRGSADVQSFMLKAKLHCARVTESDRDYEGSLTIDADLMDAVKLLPYERILVADVENGNRFETYAIPGERGSRVIGLNGATTHMGSIGDRLIIFSFCLVDDGDLATHRPLILILDEKNRPVGELKRG
jgi:aspartate 1-decarboxylase